MSYLDKRVLLKANLETRSIKEEKQSEIFFYNTDENIANLYMKLIYVTDDGLSKELQKDEVSGYSLKMTAIKPKTNQIREVDGVLSEDLINNEGTCAIFKFQLGTEFTNQIGDVICCTKIIKDAQKLNMDYFVYTIKADKLTGLNAEIESNPDLPVLKQLIKEVKELQTNGGTTGNHTHNNKITLDKITEEKVTSWDNKAEIKHEHSDYLKEHQDLTNYQTKIDKNITAEDKSIVNNINNLNAQFNTTAKDLLLEDGKLYLKKSDGTKLGTGVILPISGSGGSVTWENLTGKPSTFTPSSHSHSKSDITDFPTIPTVSNDLTNALKANYDSAYTHSTSAHAPSTAQKNSDITKEEIEAKLTGEISSHSHANSGQSEKKWRLIKEVVLLEDVNSITIDKDVNNNSFALEELMILGRDVKALNSSQLMVSHSQGGTIVTTLNDFINTTSKSLYVKLSHIGNYFLVQSRSSAYNIFGIAGDRIADRFSNFHILYDINIFVSAGTKILANSKFEIWGR